VLLVTIIIPYPELKNTGSVKAHIIPKESIN
jgi:hypothetical protein